MKKLSLIILISLVVISLLSSVGSAEKGKIQVMWTLGTSAKAIEAGIEEFREKTGIEVESLFFSHADLEQKQMLALTQGRSTPDVIAIDDVWFAQMWSYLEPIELDEEKLNTFVPKMIENCRWPRDEGSYHALPIRMGGDVIMYRKDIFEKEGIDPLSIVTWEDFLRVAIQLTKPEERQWGYAQAFDSRVRVCVQWKNILYSFGTEIFNADATKATFNTEHGIKATQILVDLANKASPPGIMNYSYENQVEAMQTGQVVMGIVWSPRFQLINSPDYPYYGEFAVLPHFPVGEGSPSKEGSPLVYGWMMGINKHSENKDLALKFIDHMSSPDMQLTMAIKYANAPTVLSVFEHPEFLAASPAAKEVVKALEYAKGRPVHVNWSRLEDAIGLELIRAILGEKTVEEALAFAEEKVNKILAE